MFYITKKRIILSAVLLIFLFFLFPVTTLAEETSYVWSNLSAEVSNSESLLTSENDNFLNLESTSAVLIDQKTRSGIIFS